MIHQCIKNMLGGTTLNTVAIFHYSDMPCTIALL